MAFVSLGIGTALAVALIVVVSLLTGGRSATSSTPPERVAVVGAWLVEHGATMVSLRTRATLEERYLQLIAEERTHS